MSNLFIYTFMCVCKLAKYVRNYVVFWKNLHSRQKIYTIAGRDGRDKFQVCGGVFVFLHVFVISIFAMTSMTISKSCRIPRHSLWLLEYTVFLAPFFIQGGWGDVGGGGVLQESDKGQIFY